MARLTDHVSYADAQRLCSPARLWELFDGDRERLNIGHECIDRHPAAEAAVRIVHAPEHGGGDEILTFGALAAWSARVAHFLADRGVGPGERVGIMLEPSLPFYAGLFGAIKRGAIAVPLFTLFGPDGLRLRIDDCAPRLLLVSPAQADIARGVPGLETVVADDTFSSLLAGYPDRYVPETRADAVAVFQYTSGTTRELPAAVRHTHRSIVTLMIAALYGTGIRPGDRFFCPSSPAWGHGLWHGTLGPLALGVATGAYAGRFDADRLLRALADHQITNLSAAATHYRMMKSAGTAARYRYAIRKLSFTGEPIDEATRAFAEETFRTPVCSMYGTTEVGVILASYPGAPDFAVKPGSLGKPVPNVEVEVQRPDGARCAPDEIGEIKVRRRDGWFPTKDRGWTDAEGYFYHGGRSDDVVISAGWTISAVEVEGALLKHPDVREAAVIGVPDPLRGLVVKAFIVSPRPGDEPFARELQEWTRTRLAQHEYPRQVEFVTELPKTPAGKVNRKVLREREAGASVPTSEERAMPPETAQLFPRITAQGLADLRRRIGVPITDTLEPWCHEATRDSIRHYAHGIGDDNPLWCDPAYAARTRHRGIIAPPSFLFTTSRIISGYVGGLSGVHAMWAGADWTWHHPVRRNDEIATDAFLKELIEHETRFAGRAVQQIYHVTFRNQRGEAVAEADSWCFRTERDHAREQGSKYKEVKARAPRRYTDEELAPLYRLYASEEVRGATPRYWQDVTVGEALPRMAKGPMTVTGFIAYAQGWGGLYIRANKLAWKQISRHSGLGIKNRFGIPDCPERVHWEHEFATAVGAPGAYDYGPERCSWLTHHLTNWMGDDGFLRRAHCKIRRHNPEGDYLIIEGRVTGKRIEDGRHVVEIAQEARNQDGEQSVVGGGVVELPSRG